MPGKVADALLGLTQYLQGENQRLDIEDKEKRIELAAEHIANKFQELGPDATPQEMQGLQFELIEDAASLGGLQENLPLISGLMQSAMNTRQITKLESQDEALGQFIKDEFGIDGAGLSGQALSQMAQLFKSYEKDILTKGKDQKMTLHTFDKDFNEIFSLEVDSFGTAEQMGLFKEQALFKHGLSRQLLHEKAALNKVGKSGFKWIKGQKGPQGQELYTDANGMGLYTPNANGQMVAWDHGKGSIQTRGAGDPTVDILGGLEKSKEYFGTERYRVAGNIAALDKGDELLQMLSGVSELTETDRQGVERLSGSVIEGLDRFFDQDTQVINARLKEIGITEGSEYKKAIDDFQRELENQRSIDRMFLQQVPRSDRDQITDVKTWNEGVNGITNIMENPGISDQVKAPVVNYIGDLNGLQDSSVVTMQDFGNLGFEQKIPLINTVSKNTTTITTGLGDTRVRHPNVKEPVEKDKDFIDLLQTPIF